MHLHSSDAELWIRPQEQGTAGAKCAAAVGQPGSTDQSVHTCLYDNVQITVNALLAIQ